MEPPHVPITRQVVAFGVAGAALAALLIGVLGYGAWQLAVDHPGTFAAAAIICGGIEVLDPEDRDLYVHAPKGSDPFAWVAEHIGKLPVWIFHGGDDNVVPTEQSRKMHAALVKLGKDVKYTEFPGVNHGSWEKAYATPELWDWMFSHTL